MKTLIGGLALVALGSSRSTEDTDYLVNEAGKPMFFHDAENNIDYCNAAGSKFFAEIWNAEKGNEIASAQSLLELKAYAFVQHCQNFNFKKADDCEYDIKFLVRHFNTTACKIATKYISEGEYSEVVKIIKSVRF